MDNGEFKNPHNTSHCVLESIGTVVRQYRRKTAITATDLSTDAHVDRKTLAKIVDGKGDYKISSLVKVVSALEVEFHQFFYKVAMDLFAKRAARKDSPIILNVEDVSINQVRIEIIASKDYFRNILG
jgi:predicted transcriptional regulator